MAFLVDGDETFFPGPTQLVPGPVAGGLKDVSFPGVRGLRRLLLGGEHRRLVHTGELIVEGCEEADARANLVALRDAIDGLALGSTALSEAEHELTSEDGLVYPHCMMDPGGFEPQGQIVTRPTAGGADARQQYRCTWTQLQPFEEET
jgi:hypothetical protein